MSKTVPMDIRKAVKFINESAQGQIATVDRIVRKIGDKAGKNYRLVALRSKDLMFEDKNDGSYYLANYKRNKGGRFTISNISPIAINESKKGHVFENICLDFVEAISEDKNKDAELAFKKLDSCRFRPTVSDASGYVVTKDGARRKFMAESKADPAHDKKLSEIISEAVFSDNVIMEDNGNVQYATFSNGDKIEVPITETARRKSVARNMKTIAESAYKSPKFQSLVKNIAGLVSKDKLREAIVESAKFLREYQEFCMLDQGDMRTLVEKALATQGVFNHVLAEDTSFLMYRSNLRVNKADILDAWRKTAKKAANSALLENVEYLSSSDTFDDDYSGFLESVLVEDSEENAIAVKFLGDIIKRLDEIIEDRQGDMESAEDVDEVAEYALQTEDVGDDVGDVGEGEAEDEDMPLARLKSVRDELKDLYDAASDETTRDDSVMERIKQIEMNIDPSVVEPGDATIDNFDEGADEDYGVDEEDIGDIDLEGEEDEEDVEGLEGEEGEDELGIGGGLGGGLEGIEGEEESLELGDEEEGEEEGEEESLEELLAASKNVPVEELGLKILQEECKLLSSDVDKYVRLFGPKYATRITESIDRCEQLGDQETAKSFRDMVPSDDEYHNYSVTVNEDIDYTYGAEGDGEVEVPEEVPPEEIPPEPGVVEGEISDENIYVVAAKGDVSSGEFKDAISSALDSLEEPEPELEPEPEVDPEVGEAPGFGGAVSVADPDVVGTLGEGVEYGETEGKPNQEQGKPPADPNKPVSQATDKVEVEAESGNQADEEDLEQEADADLEDEHTKEKEEGAGSMKIKDESTTPKKGSVDVEAKEGNQADEDDLDQEAKMNLKDKPKFGSGPFKKI